MRIAVSSWSYRDLLSQGRMQLADFPGAIAALGLEAVELNDLFFQAPPAGALARLLRRADARPVPDFSPRVVRPLRQAIIRAGVDLVALAAGGTADPGAAPTPAPVSELSTALAAARVLDTALLRLAPGGPPRPSDDELEAAGRHLRSMLAAARAFKIRLAVENDGGMGTHAETLIALIEIAGKDYTGVCLDLGNFPPGEGPAGIHRLAPYALHVHAKARAFTPAGEETQIDYRDALAALREAGYDGAISIEYEGPGDPAEGVRRTRALIEKYW